MSVQEITSIVTPPLHPEISGDLAVWTAAEKRLGTRLPGDFRDFLFCYGDGEFFDGHMSFRVSLNPLTPDFEFRVRSKHDFVNLMVANSSEEELTQFPHGVFPPSPGLLFWAGDDNGYHFFLADRRRARELADSDLPAKIVVV